jgi:hypothetical protein
MSARVKHVSSALRHALKAERHFALVDGVAFPTAGSLVNRFQVRNSVRPMHLFGHNRDHDYYFELPRKGERDPQSISRCYTAHHGDVRVVPRAKRTFSTARNPIPYATSKTDEPLVCGPWRPWRSCAPRRIARWKYLLCHSGSLRTVTCAASTSKNRKRELPRFVICPSRHRSPLDSSNGTSPR